MDRETREKNIGASIKDHRGKAGLKQIELAEMIGHSQQCLSNWERGRSVPSAVLITIAEALQCHVRDLIGDYASPKSNGQGVD